MTSKESTKKQSDKPSNLSINVKQDYLVYVTRDIWNNTFTVYKFMPTACVARMCTFNYQIKTKIKYSKHITTNISTTQN